MDLSFEQGEQTQSRGHAIIYYRTGGEILATYIVVLPLTVDFAKYIPPVLASQVKAQGMEQFSAFAIPPIPEEVPSYEFIAELARHRGDDLIYGGEVPDNDVLEAAQRVNDAVQAYAQLYQQRAELVQGTGALEPAPSDLNVGEVIFSLMSDKDKLGELAKLVGKLQFAVEGNDAHLLDETESEIRTLTRYLPENYQIPRLMEVAKQSVGRESRLAQLYLERCYKLVDGDYLGLQQIEKAIQELLGAGEEAE